MKLSNGAIIQFKTPLFYGDEFMSTSLNTLHSVPLQAETFVPPSLDAYADRVKPFFGNACTETNWSLADHPGIPDFGADAYIEDWLFDEEAGTLSLVLTRDPLDFGGVGFGKLIFSGVTDYTYEWIDESDLEELERDEAFGGLMPETLVDVASPMNGPKGRYSLITNTREVSFLTSDPPVWSYTH